MNKISSLQKLVGNTPMVKIEYDYLGQRKNAFMKCEWYNFSGSIKDRVALRILEESLRSGMLKDGQELVEVTSGNMGISFCALGAFLGHPVTIFMPKHMSEERKKIVRLYGAKLILCESFQDAFLKAEEYALHHGGFLTKQFENRFNIEAHYKTTAREILRQMSEIPHYDFLSGVGTGGTLTGVGRGLKENKNDVDVVALDPKGASLLTYGKSQGPHKIQGLSDGLIPKNYDPQLVDRIVLMEDEDAIAMAQKLCRELGIPAGISGGANFAGCVLNPSQNTVSVFADDNKKYLSTDLAVPIETELTRAVKFLNLTVM